VLRTEPYGLGHSAGIPDAVDHEDAPGTLYVKFVRIGDNLHIRKWSVDRPFDGAASYANAGSGAPLQPGDGDENYPVGMLPLALRHVAACLWTECEPHVIQDCVRIVLSAAQAIEARRGATGTGTEGNGYE
jgi:hypothetical protein